jgi:uncharacterized membrane protein
MTARNALRVIFWIGLFGLAFSGYLSYNELFAPGAASCPSVGTPGTVLGYPACVYGFFMYAAIVVIAGLGLIGRR